MKKIFFLIFIFNFSIVNAQWSNDPTQNLQISNFGYDVKACEDGNGGAFIAWDLPHDQPYVYLQWVDRYGYVKWAQPIQVSGQEDNQAVIDIIKSTNNTAILVYADMRFMYELPPPIWTKIYKNFITLTKIDTNGNFLWETKAMIDTVQQADVVIVPDETGGAYLTWGDVFPIWGDRDSTIVRLQRISNTGQRMWGDSGRYVYKEPSHLNPAPYLNNRIPEGIYFLHWEENTGLIMESIEPDGNINWIMVNDWYRRFIPTQDGGAVWAFKHTVSYTGEKMILANRMDSQGNLMWNDSGLVVIDNLGDYSGGPEFELLPDTSLVVSYIEDFTVPNYKSRIQIINQNGTFYFQDSSRYITSQPGDVALHDIIVSDSFNFILIWRNRTLNPGYYCQKYDKNMIKKWDSTDVIFSSRLHENSNYISDGNNGFINIWDEYASLEFGTYAQQVNKNGILGNPLSMLNRSKIKNSYNFQLYNNYPNPFNSSTIINFYIRKREYIVINIYNTLGQKVDILFRGFINPGYYKYVWLGNDINGNMLSSGNYFVEVISKDLKKVNKLILLK